MNYGSMHSLSCLLHETFELFARNSRDYCLLANDWLQSYQMVGMFKYLPRFHGHLRLGPSLSVYRWPTRFDHDRHHTSLSSSILTILRTDNSLTTERGFEKTEKAFLILNAHDRPRCWCGICLCVPDVRSKFDWNLSLPLKWESIFFMLSVCLWNMFRSVCVYVCAKTFRRPMNFVPIWSTLFMDFVAEHW